MQFSFCQNDDACKPVYIISTYCHSRLALSFSSSPAHCTILANTEPIWLNVPRVCLASFWKRRLQFLALAPEESDMEIPENKSPDRTGAWVKGRHKKILVRTKNLLIFNVAPELIFNVGPCYCCSQCRRFGLLRPLNQCCGAPTERHVNFHKVRGQLSDPPAPLYLFGVFGGVIVTIWFWFNFQVSFSFWYLFQYLCILYCGSLHSITWFRHKMN